MQHDRRPATGVVVMPVSMMMATCAEHARALYPTNAAVVKFYRHWSTNLLCEPPMFLCGSAVYTSQALITAEPHQRNAEVRREEIETPPGKRAVLFLPQRHERINLGRTSSWKIAGEQRHNRQRKNDRYQRYGIGRRHPEK